MPQDNSFEIQERGRANYRQGKYKEALHCFEKALKLKGKSTLSLLDSRAATHEKLGNFDGALKDARSMIHLDKQSAQGYLRTGRILMVMGKEDVALGIYEYGMRNVSVQNEHYKLLHGAHNKLTGQSSPPKARDPLGEMPLELAEMVLQQLDQNQLVKCLRVNKSWNKLLSSLPMLWTRLDLTKAKKRLRKADIRGLLRKSQYKLKYLKLSGIGNIIDADTLKFITLYCPQLSHLEMHGGLADDSLVQAAPTSENLNTLIISCNVSFDSVLELLEKCKALEMVEFWSILCLLRSADLPWRPGLMRNLKSLTLSVKEARGFGFGTVVNDILAQAPALMKLDVRGLETLRLSDIDLKAIDHPLQELTLANCQMNYFPVTTPNLKQMTLSHMLFSRELAGAISPHVDTSSLSGVTQLSMELIIEELMHPLLLSTKGNLRMLRIQGDANRNGTAFSFLDPGPEVLTRVEDLALVDYDVDDNLLEMLAISAPCLRYLDISKNRKVTGVGIKAMITRTEGEKLEWLRLDDCDGVSLDAVEYARACSVRVEIRRTQMVRGGRKVRY